MESISLKSLLQYGYSLDSGSALGGLGFLREKDFFFCLHCFTSGPPQIMSGGHSHICSVGFTSGRPICTHTGAFQISDSLVFTLLPSVPSEDNLMKIY